MDLKEKLEHQKQIINDVEKFKDYFCKRKCFFKDMTIIDGRNLTTEERDVLDCIDFPQKYCDTCQIDKFVRELKNEF
ncbi:MAG: hypothetical protein PHC62_09185 [Candidatus Izemoplasmatales bacterium]|nr:hypothetical protein [Candidatus Izemoplasmatales bacterium]